MDKKFELALIERGYDPTNAREISLEDAGQLIKEKIFKSTRENPPGIILFDGSATAMVRAGLGHTILGRSSLAISGGEGHGGLYIQDLQDFFDGQRSSVYIEGDGSYGVTVPERKGWQSENGLDLVVKTENENRESARVELSRTEGTKILYLPPTDIVQGDKLFWQHVAGQLDLDLTEIEPQYTGKSPITPWFSSTDERTGIGLTMGTRFRVYSVDAQFPKRRSAVDLKKIVDGLNVSPQTVNGDWNPGFSRDATSCVTHVYRGKGDQVLAYMGRLLERN